MWSRLSFLHSFPTRSLRRLSSTIASRRAWRRQCLSYFPSFPISRQSSCFPRSLSGAGSPPRSRIFYRPSAISSGFHPRSALSCLLNPFREAAPRHSFPSCLPPTGRIATLAGARPLPTARAKPCFISPPSTSPEAEKSSHAPFLSRFSRILQESCSAAFCAAFCEVFRFYLFFANYSLFDLWIVRNFQVLNTCIRKKFFGKISLIYFTLQHVRTIIKAQRTQTCVPQNSS